MHKLRTIYQIAYISNPLGYSKYSNIKFGENYKTLYPPSD